MSGSSIIDTLRDAINTHDPGRIASCFTSSYRCERPQHPDEDFVGSDQVLANWTIILRRIPDLRAEILRRADTGSELWSEWEMVGTDQAGAPVLLRGPVILTVSGGRIDWARFYVDPVARPAVRDPRRAPQE